MNRFLFIIPLTPDEFLSEERYKLRNMSFSMLKSQDFNNWNAILIGGSNKYDICDDRFIKIDFEGLKEEKIQYAVKYILNHKLPHEYLIRLDDDDFFNPKILNSIKNNSFDVMVDKHQIFWLNNTSYFSSRVWHWFPNTIIQKREHALSKYGFLSNSNIKKVNNFARVIENNHTNFHTYFKGKKIKLTNKKYPIYIRTISDNSITSKNSTPKDYYNRFGIWRKRKYSNFPNLNGQSNLYIKQSLNKKMISFKINLFSSLSYNSVVL
ncbi:MAG: hypothetical protein CL821_03430 [Crocinitomicaceae bacterium]|nr:hypothetical protein [Crocinitomicaceae bacterium]